MKNIISILSFLCCFLACGALFAQGNADCINAQQFCESNAGTYPSGVNTGAVTDVGTDLFGAGQSSCGAYENATAWFWFEVQTTGTLNFALTANLATTDYDYIVWGPYADLATALGSGCANDAGDSGSANEVACDFTGSTPDVNLGAVTAGEFYIMMIDNFDENGDPFTIGPAAGNTAALACPVTCAASCADATTLVCGVYETALDVESASYVESQNGGGENCLAVPIDLSVAGPSQVTTCFEYTFPAGAGSFGVGNGVSTLETGSTNGTNDCGTGIASYEVFGTGSGTCTSLTGGPVASTSAFASANVFTPAVPTAGDVYTICVTHTADNGTAEGNCFLQCTVVDVTAFSPAAVPNTCATDGPNFTFCYADGDNATPITEFEVCPDNAGETVSLDLTSGTVETCCDELFVYSGAAGSGTGTLLGTFGQGGTHGDFAANPESFTSAVDECLLFVVVADGSFSCGDANETIIAAACSIPVECNDCVDPACNTNPVQTDFATSETNFGGDCWDVAIGATPTTNVVVTADVAGTETVCTDFDPAGTPDFIGFDNCISYLDENLSGTFDATAFTTSATIYQEVGGACVALVPSSFNTYGQPEFDNNVTAGTTPGDPGSFDPSLPITYCYTYVSDGSGAPGDDDVQGNIPVAYGCTDITSLTLGAQGACNPADNSYTQDIVVTLASLPPSAPDNELTLNGQTFTIATNPQTVTLTGLNADGMAVTATGFMTVSSACTNTVNFTAPASCSVTCPVLTAAAAPAVVSSESTCTVFGGAPAGGVIAAPATACPTGSTLQYSTDGGSTWGATLPMYDQTTAITVDTRCLCDSDGTTASPTASVTTVPGTCPICPDLTAAAPAATVTSESTCTVPNGTPAGGVLAAPTATCPAGSTLEYSTDAGTTWGATLPMYDQTTAITVDTRCNCDNDTAQSSPTGSVTTVPGACPVAGTLIVANDPCDCTNGIDLDVPADGQNDLALEVITVTASAPGQTIELTAVTGLVDAAGTALVAPITLTDNGDNTYTLMAYVPADGATLYTSSYEVTSATVDNGATVNQDGGPCTSCPGPACEADNGDWNE